MQGRECNCWGLGIGSRVWQGPFGRHLQHAVREVIGDDPDRSYFAFVDDRQLAERAAAGIEDARSITEDATIVESRHATAYRSGLMHSERIEEALRAGEIRGIASTSAMELGTDIPHLQVGFNLGLPHSVGSVPDEVAAHPAARPSPYQ